MKGKVKLQLLEQIVHIYDRIYESNIDKKEKTT